MDANQMNSGLLRYRSAPSSFFANFIEGEEDFMSSHHHHRSSSPEAETMFARFMSEIGDKPGVKAETTSSQYMGVINEETEHPMAYHPPPPPPPPHPPQPAMVNHGVAENVYTGMDQQHSQVKMGSGNASNLIRHSSSPAGQFANLNVENGYAVMRGIGNYRTGNGTTGDAAASTSRLKNQMNFSSGTPSSSGLMSPISEIESESIGTSTADGGSLGNGNISNQYTPNFTATSWDDSALENFASLKRFRDTNTKMNSGLNSQETQLPQLGNQTRNLTHHFSLPKNSAEMAAILQFQDSVPCKIRAKRGCATHPRSIAERVRRTRISERMRKLQELVPNMDKQTNTADMLDLAVEYIKELQTHVKKLNDNRANCTCSSKQPPY